jgi:hypothetical protein
LAVGAANRPAKATLDFRPGADKTSAGS